jgi:non-heme chloroperoxidase
MINFGLNKLAALLIVLGAFSWLLLSASSNSSTLRMRDDAPNSVPIRDGFITTSDKARIHFRAAGRMTAESAIIFIPGLTLTASLWDHELRKFSSDRLTVAVDSRSQGESSIMLSGNTPERRAVDVHELAADLNISRFVLVGWSQGVEDVAAFIQKYGTDSLAAIVFVDSPVSDGSAEIDTHKEYSTLVLSRLTLFDTDFERVQEERVRSIFLKPHPDLDVQHIIEEARKTPPSIFISMRVMDLFGTDRRPALKKINRPTLVIASAESPLLNVQKEMANEISGARFIVVKGAGHGLFIDDPDTFEHELTLLLQAAAR